MKVQVLGLVPRLCLSADCTSTRGSAESRVTLSCPTAVTAALFSRRTKERSACQNKVLQPSALQLSAACSTTGDAAVLLLGLDDAAALVRDLRQSRAEPCRC